MLSFKIFIVMLCFTKENCFEMSGKHFSFNLFPDFPNNIGFEQLFKNIF